MPRIAPYTQQTQAPRPIVQTVDLGPGASVGLGAMAQAFGSIAQDQAALQAFAEKKREERAAVWAHEQVMGVRSHWLEELPRRQEAASETAEGFTLQALADFDAQADELIKAAPTQASRNWLKERLSAVRLGLQQDALLFEARRGVEFKVNGLARSVDQARIAAEFRPEDFPVLAAEQLAAIEASGLDASTRAKLIQDSQLKLADAAVRGMIRRDPYAALKELNDEQSQTLSVRALSFDQRQTLRGAAETEIRRREAEARAHMAELRERLRSDVQDALAAREAGLPATLPSHARFIEAYGDEGNERYRNALETFRIYDVVGQAAHMRPNEALELLEQLKPKQQEGAAEASQRYDIAVRLWQGQRRQLEQDPVGTLLSRDERVREAFDALSSDDPTAVRRYIETVQGAQEALGVAEPKLLPQGLAQEMAAQLAPNPEQPGARAQRIAQFEQQWGAAWPRVLREVAPKLEGLGQILPFVPAQTAARLDVLSAQRDAVMQVLASTGLKKDLATALAEQLEPLNATFPPGVLADGPVVWQQYYQAAELLAADMMRGGASPERAAKDAVEQILGNRYQFVGTLRIPRVTLDGEPIDAQAIRSGALYARNTLDVDLLVQPTPFQTQAEAQADRLAQVRSEGFWVTNSDETGAFLALPDGIVLGADRQPIELTWEELTQLGMDVQRRRKAAAQAFPGRF